MWVLSIKTRLYRILRDAVRFPNGELGTYIRIVGAAPPGAIIFPVYQGKVLLIRHFRHATRTLLLEIPRGFGTRGLSSTENACLEVISEIGATISSLTLLGRVYQDTGMLANYNEFFYATIATYGQPETNEGNQRHSTNLTYRV